MAMNNPYSSYQRYATVKVPQIKQVDIDSPEATNTPMRQNVTTVNFQKSTGNKVADQYLENAVATATPEELTLMLYDGAIKFMNQSIIYIDMKNIEKTNVALVKAQNIFSELMCTLKMEFEVSASLYNLYDFFKRSLIQANVRKDTQLIREVIGLTRDLRDTWAQAMKIAKKG